MTHNYIGFKILTLSAVFPPEPVVSARTIYQVAEFFQKQNYTIQVITAYPNRPSGKLFHGFHRNLYTKQILSEQYSIVRCFSFFSKKSSVFSRFLENISFAMTSTLAILFSKKPDVIYANTWPIFAQGLVSLVAHLRNIPLVLSVQDIYPESLVSQGRIRENGWVYRILLAMDRRITRSCSAIVVISERFARLYRDLRGIPPEKIKVVPNWIDSKSVVSTPKESYRQKINISEKAFVFVYGGNIGVAAGVETVIRALENVNSDREIVLVIAGSGSNLQACQALAKSLSKGHVLFHTPWLQEDTSEVLGAADVLVLPTSGKQSLASVPSKMISYLLAARPILAAVHPESDTAEVIGKTGCGWVVPPDSPDQLARKIEEISKIPEDRLEQMGQSGREYALQNFISEICLPKVIDVILSSAVRNQ